MRPAYAHYSFSSTARRRTSTFFWILNVMLLFGTCALGSQDANSPDDDSPSASQDIVAQSRAISQRMKERGVTWELIDQQRELLLKMEHWLATEAGGNSSASLNKDPASTEKSPLKETPLGTSSHLPENRPGVAPEFSLKQSASRQELEDAVWGHLPPQERDPLIRAFNERFLPEYDERVRAYFEALAKRPRKTLDPRN